MSDVTSLTARRAKKYPERTVYCDKCSRAIAFERRTLHYSCEHPEMGTRCSCRIDGDYAAYVAWFDENVAPANPNAARPLPCPLHGGAS